VPYVSLPDLAERPGARELAQVASREHGQIVDYALMDATLRGTARTAWGSAAQADADAAAARITDAVAEADALIDGFLARRGYLPLDPVPGVVTAWSRAIARYLLHKGRISDDKDPIVRDYRDALRLLQLTADGKFSLGADDAALAANRQGDVRFVGGSKVFGRDSLRGFR
jgi:phage gp36-like protein